MQHSLVKKDPPRNRTKANSSDPKTMEYVSIFDNLSIPSSLPIPSVCFSARIDVSLKYLVYKVEDKLLGLRRFLLEQLNCKGAPQWVGIKQRGIWRGPTLNDMGRRVRREKIIATKIDVFK